MFNNGAVMINHSEGKNEDMGKVLILCQAIEKSVDRICKESNPEMYKAYHGNHCIQTASAMSYVLRTIDDAKCNIMYGIMHDDTTKGKMYNHAFLQMKYNDRYYIVDVSRKDRPALVVCTDKLHLTYGKTLGFNFKDISSGVDAGEYNDIVVEKLTILDQESIDNEKNEFFTKQSSLTLYNRVMNEIEGEIFDFKGITRL